MIRKRTVPIILLGCAWLAAAEDNGRALTAPAKARSGDLASVERLYREAIEKARVEGNSLEAAAALNGLGIVYLESGRYASAEKAYREALAVFEAHARQAATALERCLHNLAVTYTFQFQGRFGEAEAAFLRLQHRWLSASPLPAFAASTELAMADLYLETGDLSAAEKRLNRALAIHRAEPGASPGVDLSGAARLAEVYRRQGRYGKAEAAIRKALALASPGAEAITMARLENQFGIIEYERDRLTSAEAAWRRSLAWYEKALGPGSVHEGTVLMNLGELNRYEARHAEAEELFRRALAIYEKTYGPGHSRTAVALTHLGGVWVHQGRSREAEGFYRRALAILEDFPSGLDHEKAVAMKSLARLHREQGRREEALEWSEQACGGRNGRSAPGTRNSRGTSPSTRPCSEAVGARRRPRLSRTGRGGSKRRIPGPVRLWISATSPAAGSVFSSKEPGLPAIELTLPWADPPACPMAGGRSSASPVRVRSRRN